MIKSAMIAAVAFVSAAVSAQAATLGGTFKVTAVNVQNITGTASQATEGNYLAALGVAANPRDEFTYTGLLDFGTFDETDGTTIAGWLGAGATGLDDAFGKLQLSKPDIGNGTATTTFFFFDRFGPLTAGEFTVKHDDGMAIFDDGVLLGGTLGPTVQVTTNVTGFDGGAFSLLYVATNGDPSVLHVETTATPVPLPAPVALLIAGVAGLGLVARRRKAA